MTEEQKFLDDYLLYRLARASAAVSSQFHAELAERGVSVATWRIVAVLSDGPTTVNALAGAVMLKQATLSKALDRLERDSLIARARSRDDRRQVDVTLTIAGRALAADLIPRAKEHQDSLLASYTAEQRAVLNQVLQDLMELAEQ